MDIFKIGDRVSFESKEPILPIELETAIRGKVGIIKKVFSESTINTAYVLFENMEGVKLPFSVLKKVTTSEPKKVVELTREDFHDLAVKFTSLKFLEDLFDGEDMNDGKILEFASVAAVVIDNLENLVFGEEI